MGSDSNNSEAVRKDSGNRRGSADPLAPLLERARRGDESAFSTLYGRTSGRLNALAISICGNGADAEDVLAEVYLQAWRNLASWDPGRGSVMTWLTIMCRSRSLDVLRRRRTRAEVSDDRVPEQSVHPEPVDDDDAVTAALKQALGTLREDQRQLLALAFFRGMSHQDIATATDTPLGTVKSHIRRGLLALREVL